MGHHANVGHFRALVRKAAIDVESRAQEVLRLVQRVSKSENYQNVLANLGSALDLIGIAVSEGRHTFGVSNGKGVYDGVRARFPHIHEGTTTRAPQCVTMNMTRNILGELILAAKSLVLESAMGEFDEERYSIAALAIKQARGAIFSPNSWAQRICDDFDRDDEFQVVHVPARAPARGYQRTPLGGVGPVFFVR